MTILGFLFGFLDILNCKFIYYTSIPSKPLVLSLITNIYY